MPERITEQQVRHVARLSRLKLDDERCAFFATQLAHVLEYIDKLNELDVEGVEPLSHPLGVTDRLREDEPSEPMSVEDALANAPAADPPFFKVPKVIGEASGA